MAKEIERKFLVKGVSYRERAVERRHITQGYLSRDKDRVVRIRICDDRAWLTVKTANTGAVRCEWEYEIPVTDAREMLSACTGGVIEKTRYCVPAGNGRLWEVDEFAGKLAPLVVAEIELADEDEQFAKPDFIGDEVTDDPRYFNSALAAQA